MLYRYNIIGDGTPQALIPILTGKTELELPDTRKRLKNTHYVNSYPLIWDEYKKAGYVTAFFEDVPNIGTFTYRLNGFKVSIKKIVIRFDAIYYAGSTNRSLYETILPSKPRRTK